MVNVISVWMDLSVEVLQVNNKGFQCLGLGKMHSSVKIPVAGLVGFAFSCLEAMHSVARLKCCIFWHRGVCLQFLHAIT